MKVLPVLPSNRVLIFADLHVTNVEDHISNFLQDHPDAAQGTFLELYSHYFPYFSGRSSSKKASSQRVEPSDVNTSICWADCVDIFVFYTELKFAIF